VADSGLNPRYARNLKFQMSVLPFEICDLTCRVAALLLHARPSITLQVSISTADTGSTDTNILNSRESHHRTVDRSDATESFRVEPLFLDADKIEDKGIGKRGLTMAPESATRAAVTGLHIGF